MPKIKGIIKAKTSKLQMSRINTKKLVENSVMTLPPTYDYERSSHLQT